MSSTIVIILVVIAVLILSLIAFLIIRRQRYPRAARTRLDLRVPAAPGVGA
jgi:preprotein translocase subunit YajC